MTAGQVPADLSRWSATVEVTFILSIVGAATGITSLVWNIIASQRLTAGGRWLAAWSHTSGALSAV